MKKTWTIFKIGCLCFYLNTRIRLKENYSGHFFRKGPIRRQWKALK